jgi:hypothetical protein
MKYLLSIVLASLMTITCYGQNQHLEPADFKNYNGVLKDYYDNLLPLLYKGFTEKPFARYTLIPFEHSFSVEKKDDKYFIISNWLSKSYWYTKNKKHIKLRTASTEIDEELYKTIGELFQLLARQTHKPDKKVEGFDGATYYFTVADKDGQLKIGQTWSPDADSYMGRLVKISDNLFLIGAGNEISQSEIQTEIEHLTSDMGK